MILVTAGGGEDGYSLIRTYLEGLAAGAGEVDLKTLIVTGPELAESYRREVKRLARCCPQARVIEFTDEMMNYMNAADVVVSMAGYNTICEILSLRKRAVIVPRIEPVKEQEIRAERMARLGLFKMIHPARLTPRNLLDAVMNEVEGLSMRPQASAKFELDALPRISSLIGAMVAPEAYRDHAGRKRLLARSGG